MEQITPEQIKFLFDFKNRRKETGLTLRRVESITGISNSYLSQLETGKIDNPSFTTVVTLHNLYLEQENIKVREARRTLEKLGYNITKKSPKNK